MPKKLFIETYGCQMNVNDSEVILSILSDQCGYVLSDDPLTADLIVINTCAIREGAETRIWGRLDQFTVYKRSNPNLRVAIVGCMAERIKDKLLEHKAVDIVAGPDAYRTFPALLESLEPAVNVKLDKSETYHDILPKRIGWSKTSSYISIMRGCNNVCSYCVVPYTRGPERSRSVETILAEARNIISQGYKEIILLGQNVDSYNYEGTNFASLIRLVAALDRSVRIRFSTSHPKDISDELIYAIAEEPNVCRQIHLPVQSGSDIMLEKMRRRYNREWYLERVRKIREVMPDCGISTDIIAGFCGETEDDHKATLSLMKEVCFDFAFMFAYSERPGTLAARNYPDDISIETKTARLNEIIALQGHCSLQSNGKDLGKRFEVLVEGPSKKGENQMCGRNSAGKMCVFPAGDFGVGDYVNVRVESVTSATLICTLV
ncbi:MAG: tRNA (N6-isopentenyl adenosine(37)-C2)-methylthiotransferase MiaB [Bacteroidales bacterium]|nr:tRNA (N6-isopentenyl adenosine(37)-C2)-methylthiotransferase MiaB [Bacteroidales bacterium]